MESLRSAGFQPAKGKSNEAGWKPALRIKIALGKFRVLPEARGSNNPLPEDLACAGRLCEN
jgi:hypothetical protein